MEPNNSNKPDRRRGPRHDHLVVTQYDNGITTYRGRAECALDDKGRLTLPKEYREMLKAHGEDRVYLVPVIERGERYVRIMRRSEFEALKEKIASHANERELPPLPKLD